MARLQKGAARWQMLQSDKTGKKISSCRVFEMVKGLTRSSGAR
jgi:hypothetical protein